MKAIMPISLTLLTFVLAGCTDDQDKLANLRSGDELYTYYCADCHAKRGPGAKFENRNKNRRALAEYQILLLMEMGDPKRHAGMPTFPQLEPAQKGKIARHIVQLQLQAEASETSN